MAGRPPPLPPAPLPPGPLEFPLTAFPDHPVARALRDDGLSRRWLLPVGGLPVTSAGGDGGGGKGPVPSRPVAAAMVSRAALTQPGLAQRVGWTSDVEADDGRVVQQVHLMLVPYATVNGITLGTFVAHPHKPPSSATPGTTPAAVAAPAFGRFVLDEAAGELVALRPERRAPGLFCLAITGAGAGHGGSAGAAHRCMMHLDGAGATGVPDGPITVQRRNALCCGAGWASAAAGVPNVTLAPAAAAAVVAAPTPPSTSPADFHGFDTAVRRLLGGVAARRRDPTAAAVALPLPLGGRGDHGGPRRSGGGCLWPPLSAAAALLKPAALHCLPPAVGVRMEVALVQAALDVVVERPWWSTAAVTGEEGDATATRAAAATADATVATAAALVAAADAAAREGAATAAAAAVTSEAGAAARLPWAVPLCPAVGSPVSPPRLAPRPAGYSVLLADASACRPPPALPPRGRVKRRPRGASPPASDAAAAAAGAATAAVNGRPSSRIARNRAAAARANAVRAATRAARRAARAAAAGTSTVGGAPAGGGGGLAGGGGCDGRSGGGPDGRRVEGGKGWGGGAAETMRVGVRSPQAAAVPGHRAGRNERRRLPPMVAASAGQAGAFRPHSRLAAGFALELRRHRRDSPP